ncbi:MAG: hypothetical protein DMF55_12985 [Acidobacteria bacterium]|nr:MAG: hypothetical protein DMF55_12985 [Acidobacteriota bacterium]
MKGRPTGAVSHALLVGLLAAGLTSEVEGAEPRRVVVRLEVQAHPVITSGAKACTVSREIADGANGSFWASFGQVHPDADRIWKAAGSEIRCGEGGFAGREARPTGSTGVPYFEVGAAVTPSRSVRTQGVPGSKNLFSTATDVAAVVTLRKLSGFSATGEPIYGVPVQQRRMFTIENGDDALVPLLVPDSREKSEFGIHEVMLRIDTRVVVPPATDYGAISLRSETPGAEVLLDGGRVDRTSKEKDLLLRNVPVGDREVRIRDGRGREARRIARVRKDRTVLVALSAAARELSPPPNALVPTGKNERGYEAYRRKRDGAVMVKIPEGEFHMGNLETEGHPQPHTVYVSTFLMDKTPVSFGQYKRFLEASGWPLPPDDPYWGILDDHPAVFVTREESRAYCEWVGGRLPTEAEREKAARGRDERKYPWGDKEPDPSLGVFRHTWGYVATEPVGSHPAGQSPYGLLDMGGNVWEACEDWFDPHYYEVSPKKDPRGPATGRSYVVRGGSWDSRPSVLSSSCRNFAYIGYREGDFGFRCAADPP